MLTDNGVPIRSVSRSISVLRTINQHGSISLIDIAKCELLPYPTAFRIVQTLLHEGLIEREHQGKRYRPTALVESLSSGYSENELRTAAQPIMSRLTREIGWPMFLSVRVGMRMVIRASTHHETTLTFHDWKPGVSIPLADSATGLAWLAHQPPGDISRFLEWGVGAHPRLAGGDDMRAHMDCLGKIREQGYCLRPSLYNDDSKTTSIAVPVWKDGATMAVLTLTYFASAMREGTATERFAQALQRTGAEIARVLAWDRNPN